MGHVRTGFHNTVVCWIVSAAVLISLPLVPASLAQPVREGVDGDVNGDGKVDARDYVLVKRSVLLSDDPEQAYDVNGDGNVDVLDYIMLKRLVLRTGESAGSTIAFESIAKLDTQTNIRNRFTEELTEYLRTLPEEKRISVVFSDESFSNYYAFNAQAEYYSASITKLPFCKWLCTRMDDGDLSPDKELILSDEYRRTGAGILYEQESGTRYTVSELIDYAIRYSDNTAQYMLFQTFGGTGYKKYLASLHSDWKPNSRGYGNVSAADMFALTLDVARYRGENAGRLWDPGTNTKHKLIDPRKFGDAVILQKNGAILKAGSQVHHSIAVFDNDGKRFAIVILTDFDPAFTGYEEMTAIAEYACKALSF